MTYSLKLRLAPALAGAEFERLADECYRYPSLETLVLSDDMTAIANVEAPDAPSAITVASSAIRDAARRLGLELETLEAEAVPELDGIPAGVA